MVIECQNCHAKYNVNEEKIPAAGVRVKCHKCQQIIEIRKPASTGSVSPPPMPEVTAPPAPKPPTPPTSATPREEPGYVPEPSSEDRMPSPPIPPDAPAVEAPSETPSFPEAPSETPSPPPSVELPEPPSEEEPLPSPPEETTPDSPPPPEPSAKLEIETTQYPGATVEKPAGAAAELPEGMSEEEKKLHQRARRLAKALASDLVLYNQDKVEQGLREGTLAQLLGSEIRRSWEYYCQQIPKNIIDSSDYFKEQLNKIVGKGKEIFK